MRKKRTEYPTIEAPAGAYSEWQYPVMKDFGFACCDCGLVHDITFEVLRVEKHHRDGTSTMVLTSGHKVRFKVRRNARATGQLRRHRHRDT